MHLPRPEDFDTKVQRAREWAEADPRLAGLAVGGSWGEGRSDRWSDLDMIFVAYPEHAEAVLNDRGKIARQLGDLLVSYKDEEREPRLMICLFDEPLLHIGIKVVTLDGFAERVEDPQVIFERDTALSDILAVTRGFYPVPGMQWVEDRFWLWMHYAALRLGRGELLELADHLSYIRNQALGSLLLIQHGKAPRRVRRAEKDLPPEAFAKLQRTVGAYDRQALIDAIYATIELYRDLRTNAGLHGQDLLIHQQAETRVLELLAELAKPGSES